LKNHYRTETDYLPINRWPQDERPREKLIKKGPEYLSDCELLAIILRTGVGNSKEKFSALDLAKKILAEYGSLKNLLDLSLSEFLKINGIGSAKTAQVMAALEPRKMGIIKVLSAVRKWQITIFLFLRT